MKKIVTLLNEKYKDKIDPGIFIACTTILIAVSVITVSTMYYLSKVGEEYQSVFFRIIQSFFVFIGLIPVAITGYILVDVGYFAYQGLIKRNKRDVDLNRLTGDESVSDVIISHVRKNIKNYDISLRDEVIIVSRKGSDEGYLLNVSHYSIIIKPPNGDREVEIDKNAKDYRIIKNFLMSHIDESYEQVKESLKIAFK